MADNQAVVLPSLKAYPFTIQEAPKPQPGPGQLVIKNAAVAIVRLILPFLDSVQTDRLQPESRRLEDSVGRFEPYPKLHMLNISQGWRRMAKHIPIGTRA